jgi:hypothetical protein
MLIFQLVVSAVGIVVGILTFRNREPIFRKISDEARPKSVQARSADASSPAYVGFAGVACVVIAGIILLNGLSKLL